MEKTVTTLTVVSVLMTLLSLRSTCITEALSVHEPPDNVFPTKRPTTLIRQLNLLTERAHASVAAVLGHMRKWRYSLAENETLLTELEHPRAPREPTLTVTQLKASDGVRRDVSKNILLKNHHYIFVYHRFAVNLLAEERQFVAENPGAPLNYVAAFAKIKKHLHAVEYKLVDTMLQLKFITNDQLPISYVFPPFAAQPNKHIRDLRSYIVLDACCYYLRAMNIESYQLKLELTRD